MKYTELFSTKELYEHIALGWIREIKKDNLRMFTYDRKAQLEWYWPDIVKICRGLVVDEKDNIIIRPFVKFFSDEQLEGSLPYGDFVIYEKHDGSLIQVALYNGEYLVTTKGSFDSTQAKDAQKILDTVELPTKENVTYLYEYVAPDNRIVVRYDEPKLIPLTVIDNETGKDLVEPFGRKWSWEEYNTIMTQGKENFEGFVLFYPDTCERVKCKTDTYVRLHKLREHCSRKAVIQLLIEGKYYDLVDQVDAEFQPEFEKIYDEIMTDRKELLKTLITEYNAQTRFTDRKERAIYYKSCTYPHIMFAKYDGKEYDKLIYKELLK